MKLLRLSFLPLLFSIINDSPAHKILLRFDKNKVPQKKLCKLKVCSRMNKQPLPAQLIKAVFYFKYNVIKAQNVNSGSPCS